MPEVKKTLWYTLGMAQHFLATPAGGVGARFGPWCCISVLFEFGTNSVLVASYLWRPSFGSDLRPYLAAILDGDNTRRQYIPVIFQLV
jgi:hypothetical protein